MLQKSGWLEWEDSCMCAFAQLKKCAFLTEIYIKEKLPHNTHTHTHTAVGTKISVVGSNTSLTIFKEIFLLLTPYPLPFSFSVTPLDTYYSAFDGVMTTTIALLLSAISCMCVCVLFSQIFANGLFFSSLRLLNSLSISRQLLCSVSSHKILLPIYRKNDLCAVCYSLKHTYRVCHNVDIAFGDQYTHRDRSTNTPYTINEH